MFNFTKTTAKTFIDPDQLRAELVQFWDEAFNFEPTRYGFALAMPQTDPEGWQIVVDIEPTTPKAVKLTDHGRTLGALAAKGQNIEADSTAAHIDEIAKQNHLEREGWELFRHLPLPLESEEIHVFTEGLAAIHHLHILHVPVPRAVDVADKTLRRIFSERSLEPRIHARLSGKAEKNIRVDYLIEDQKRVAFKILHSKRRLLPAMEQWGFRWLDLKKTNPTLQPVMLYDPNRQEVDSTSQAIGEEVCTYFGPYDHTDRIHAVLEGAQS